MAGLKGKTALVTGGGRRVGAAIACALGREGMRVAVHYHHSVTEAEGVAEQIVAAGGEALLVQADLSDAGQARRLAVDVERQLGGLDLLVCSAANYERVPLEQVDDGHFTRALDLNLMGSFRLAHGLRESLAARGGSIVFITCTSRLSPYKDFLPYQVSKAAVHQLMRVLALELAPQVRVNAVAPGTVMPPEGLAEADAARLRDQIPLGRFGKPQDVADAVVHLAQAQHVTGTEIVVDGGLTRSS